MGSVLGALLTEWHNALEVPATVSLMLKAGKGGSLLLVRLRLPPVLFDFSRCAAAILRGSCPD